jgi:hypothetical protein
MASFAKIAEISAKLATLATALAWPALQRFAEISARLATLPPCW